MSHGPSLLGGVVPHGELYGRALSAAYRWFYKIIDPDYALEQDADTWRKIWRDAKIAQAIAQRLATVAGKQWTVQPGSDQPTTQDLTAADLVKDLLRQIRNFSESRSMLAAAIFHGRSFSFIEGRRVFRSFARLSPQAWWTPTRLTHVDKRRFQWVPEIIDGRLTTHLEMWSVIDERFKRLEPSKIRQFARVVYNDEEGRLGYGRGLLESMYFLWWAKQEVMKEGLSGVERWAQGIIGAKMDLRSGLDKTTDEARDEFLKALEEMRSRHVLVVDKEDELIIAEGGRGGSNIVHEFLKYIDDALMGVIMGSVLPFGGTGKDTGSLARAKVEEDTSDILVTMDREKLDDAMTSNLIRWLWEKNRPQLVAVGLGDALMPRFDLTQQRRQDPEITANVAAILLAAGIPLKKSELYEKTGWTQPDDDDEVIEGQTSSQISKTR